MRDCYGNFVFSGNDDNELQDLRRCVVSQAQSGHPLEPIIYGYHSCHRPLVEMYGGEDDGKNLFLGFELETAKPYDWRNDDTIFFDTIYFMNKTLGNNKFIHCERDGSIGNGYEMISMPATIDYHRANKDKYKAICNNLLEKKFTKHRTTCGLHIHFNKSFFGEYEDLYTCNLLYLMDKFWANMVLYSNRNYQNILHWASPYTDTPTKIVEDNKKYGSGRYHAINLTNSKTIEFRLFASTLDSDDLLATLDLVNNMVRASKTHNIKELQELKFTDFLTTDEQKKYWRKCNYKVRLKKLANANLSKTLLD